MIKFGSSINAEPISEIVRLEEIKKVINDYKKILTEQYRVKSIGVFGSYATDIPTSESDIDILV